jgi:hypothetical protein
MEAKHTATPWTVEDIGANVLLIKSRAVPVNESASSTERDYYSRIASVTQRDPHPRHNGGISMTNCKANAEFIARACNCLGPHLQKLDELMRKTGMSEVDLIGRLLVAEVNRLMSEVTA